MNSRFNVTYKGKLIATASFSLYGMGGTCSVKHLSYVNVSPKSMEDLTSTQKCAIAKLLSNAAFDPATKCNTDTTDFPGHPDLRKRILLTTRVDSSQYFTRYMIELLGVRVGRDGPGGHGDYKMILGILDEDLHSKLVVDSAWELERR